MKRISLRMSPSFRIAAAAGVALIVAAGLFAAGCGAAAVTTTSAAPTTTTGSVAPASSTTSAAPTSSTGSTGTTVAAGATTTTAAGPEVAKVDLMMDWIPWVLDIPVDVAQAKGFYKAQGLTVNQTIPADATDVVKFVSTGKSQFGLYYSPDMLMALDAGSPLVSVAALMSHAPVGMAFKPGLAADSPAVLAGKVASVPLIPSTRASFTSMLAKAGVDPNSVKVVDPGFELVAPLLAGTVDAAAFTEFGELVQAKAEGKDLSYLDFRDWGTPDFAFLDVITTQDFAKTNPNTTRAFVRATCQGLEYAAANPDEAVAIYVKAHPELEPTLLLAQWKAAIASLGLATGGHPTGWQDLDSWAQLNAWMDSADLIREPLDITPAVTNEYLDAAR
jgi:putative hydroxymethylpyrimidine transport system substrate-binding protein